MGVSHCASGAVVLRAVSTLIASTPGRMRVEERRLRALVSDLRRGVDLVLVVVEAGEVCATTVLVAPIMLATTQVPVARTTAHDAAHVMIVRATAATTDTPTTKVERLAKIRLGPFRPRRPIRLAEVTAVALQLHDLHDLVDRGHLDQVQQLRLVEDRLTQALVEDRADLRFQRTQVEA